MTISTNAQWKTTEVPIKPAIYDTDQTTLAITTELGASSDSRRIIISDGNRRIVVLAESNWNNTEFGITAFVENIIRFLEPVTIINDDVRRALESYRNNRQNVDVMTVIESLPADLKDLKLRKLSHIQEDIRSTLLGKMMVAHYMKVFCAKDNLDYLYDLMPASEQSGCRVDISRYNSKDESTTAVATMMAEHEVDNCFETIARGIKKREAAGFTCEIDSDNTNF